MVVKIVSYNLQESQRITDPAAFDLPNSSRIFFGIFFPTYIHGNAPSRGVTGVGVDVHEVIGFLASLIPRDIPFLHIGHPSSVIDAFSLSYWHFQISCLVETVELHTQAQGSFLEPEAIVHSNGP